MNRKIFLLLMIVLSVAVIIRMVFYKEYAHPGITADSRSYYETGKIIQEKGILVDPWRTPVYPLFLMTVERVSGMKEIGYHTTPGDLSYVVVFVQSILGVVSTGLFFLLLFWATQNKYVSTLFAIVFSLNPIVIGFERIIATESLAVLWIIVFLQISLWLFRKPVLWGVFVFTIWSVVGVFLRPAFLLLPCIAFVFFVIKQHSIRNIVSFFFAAAVYGGVCLFYTHMNGTIHQYKGFTRVSDLNIVGKILQFNLPVSVLPKENILRDSIDTYRANGGAPDPWRFLEAFPMYYTSENFSVLSQSSKRILFASIPQYSISVVQQIPSALVDTRALTIDWYFSFTNSLGIHVLKNIYLLSWHLRLTALIVGSIVWVFLSKERLRTLFILILMLSYVGLTVAASYDDFGRHMIVLDVPLYLFAGIIFSWFYSQLQVWYRRYQQT